MKETNTYSVMIDCLQDQLIFDRLGWVGQAAAMEEEKGRIPSFKTRASDRDQTIVIMG